jgi:hypothetical protein
MNTWEEDEDVLLRAIHDKLAEWISNPPEPNTRIVVREYDDAVYYLTYWLHGDVPMGTIDLVAR